MTVFWTKAERKLVREALDELRKKLPHRTPRAITEMIRRIEEGEFEE